MKLRARQKEKREALGIIAKNKSSCFVVEDKGEVVGSVFGAFNGRRGWVYHLVIHPKYQRKGYGSILIQRAEKALKKIGATRVLLGIWKSDKWLLSFYSKNGYCAFDDSIFLFKDLE